MRRIAGWIDLALVAVYAMWFARVMTRQDEHRFTFTALGLLVLTFLILAVFSFIDLHIHTTHSDGAFSARAIVGHAQRAGLATISITDHDSTAALDEAITAGRGCGVAVVPGVELSTSLDGQDVHILGYFLDHTHSGVQAHLKVLRGERLRRAVRIVGRLNALNVPLPFEAVLDQAGHGSIGRPHIAHAMVELGLTQSYHEAFLKYIGAGRPAYEQHAKMTPRDAVALIAMAGGLSFIAHPGASVTDDMLRALIADGVDGIETVHPCHTPEQEAYWPAAQRP